MIVSVFDNKSGFFSMFFFFINHYIYSEKNNLNFKIDNSNWLFKYKLGWEDYFENIDINDKNNLENTICIGFNTLFVNYPIFEYKNVINKIYNYNEIIKNKISEKRNILGIDENINYSSIFIRRGDKLITESKLINSKDYLEYLLSISPSSNLIYLQTDDYNCYIELSEYINNNNLDIKLLTLCNPNNRGMIIFDGHKKSILNNHSIYNDNANYIRSNNTLKNFKPVNQMNNEEIYDHTIEMIIGIDLVLTSELVITDYSSNVARFIKLKHKNSDLVYDVVSKSNVIDMDSLTCPSYCF